MMNRISETSIRMMPQSRPGVPERMACGGEAAREGQLQPYQPRQHQSHQSNRERSDRILDGDDFGVLAKDVFRHPALRMIEFYVFHFGGLDDSSCANRGIDHWNALALSDEARRP